MKLAVTYQNGEVFQHFGHTEFFKIYEIKDGKTVSSEVISTNGEGHGALAGFLGNLGVTVLICGGIGGGARDLLEKSGIAIYGGVHGNADAVVEEYLADKLNYDPNVRCLHHDGKCSGHHE